MKCPNCGREIPEGHMYCDDCGTEINFVPDFEPEIENEINATLSSVADELRKKESKFVLNKIGIGIAAIAVVLISVFVVFFVFNDHKNSRYYMNLAAASKSSGNMTEAIEYLERGVKDNPNDSDIIFRLSDYYLEIDDVDNAVQTLMLITDSEKFSDEKKITAYESIISIYKQYDETEKITALLADKDNELVASLRNKYVPESPSMSPESGTYEGSVTISITSTVNSQYQIYYTVNGDDPNSGSILYEGEIVIDADGEYDVKAVCVNAYDICSEITENIFVVEQGAPAAPEIMEPSGDYNQNTMIVAVAESGCTIFYTTDGTDPTMESKQYISPITMPVGTSHYKFIAYNNDGECSEIVERDYHLIYTRLVSTEQAVNNLVNTLVRLDILLDTAGKVRGIEGHNEYIYNSVIEIQGAGEYYMIIENHVSNDGTVTPTGLMYAVNTHDGTVNRLGYDSSGKYTLITISNR